MKNVLVILPTGRNYPVKVSEDSKTVKWREDIDGGARDHELPIYNFPFEGINYRVACYREDIPDDVIEKFIKERNGKYQ